MLLIEGRDERFVNEVGEQNTLWYRVGVQRKRLRCRKGPSLNGFLRRRGRLCFYDIGFREFFGLGLRALSLAYAAFFVRSRRPAPTVFDVNAPSRSRSSRIVRVKRSDETRSRG